MNAGELWSGACVPDQSGVCRRVRVRPHLTGGASSTSRVACADERSRCRSEQWSVCLPEHHPGYVSWQEYLATRERLRRNMRACGEGGGAAREGLGAASGNPAVRAVRATDANRLLGQRRPIAALTCAYARFITMVPSMRASHSAGLRLDSAVAAAFLDAVTPTEVRACTEAVGESSANTKSAFADTGWRWSAESSRPAARNANSTPVSRRTVSSPARWSERGSRHSHSWRAERRKLAELETRRTEPLTQAERQALTRLAQDLPEAVERADDGPRDRKELLRTLVSEVVRHDQPGAAARGGRDHLGRRRPQPASGATDPPRRRAQAHR